MKAVASMLLALCAGAASAQETCPHASEVRQEHIVGMWQAEFDGLGHGGMLLLDKHPVYSDSFSGAINRNGERRPLAGDVEDGEFTMEESADGVRIAATWLGEVVEGSCGREIRGTWTAEGEQAGHAFRLRKQ